MILDSDNTVQERSLELISRLKKQLLEGLHVRVPVVIIHYISEGRNMEFLFTVIGINNYIYRFSKKQQEEIIDYNLPRLCDFFINTIMKDEPNAFPV